MDPIQYLTFSMIIFLLGIWGILLNRRNILIMLMSIELMLLAVNFNFLVFSVSLDDMMGQLFSLLVLAVAAVRSPSLNFLANKVTTRVVVTVGEDIVNLMMTAIILQNI